jgi:hypothetical protein
MGGGGIWIGVSESRGRTAAGRKFEWLAALVFAFCSYFRPDLGATRDFSNLLEGKN